MWPTLRAWGRGLLLAFVAGLLAVRTDAACITEPIMGGADPAVIYTNGFFYSLRTAGGDVRIRRSTTLAGMASGTEVTVFTPNADIRSDISFNFKLISAATFFDEEGPIRCLTEKLFQQ